MRDTKYNKVYKPSLSEKTSSLILALNECFEQAEHIMYTTNIQSREMSIALTNLEQAWMWATRAIIVDGEKLDKP